MIIVYPSWLKMRKDVLSPLWKVDWVHADVPVLPDRDELIHEGRHHLHLLDIVAPFSCQAPFEG